MLDTDVIGDVSRLSTYRGAKKEVKKILDMSIDSSTSDTDEESLTSSSSSESSDGDVPRKRRRGHKKKTKKANRSKSTKHSSRATTLDDILKPYNKVFNSFKKEGSISKACTKVGVGRNTLALTAVVAEIQLADPEFYQSIPEFRAKEEKLFHFAKRCLESLTADLRSAIENAKKECKPLPIKYKLR
ncbi:coiled-coil domain-containing protein 106-like [Megalops cyprinoides]|uniref:coiled-coil domain-containing protein 106-like n=1 Tax=Megalops cyprinoides TaxID=118141 RepID=UPI00186512AD|nr:coiled-coil domain-containing protein 106-like [Megalops cyprinoides]